MEILLVNFSFSILDWTGIGLFTLMSTIQLYFYLFSFKSLYCHQQEEKLDRDIPVSVIIAARNEKENLQAFLPLILNQRHENFEVIVVNDHSVDGTMEWLKTYNHSRLVRIDHQGETGKKAALAAGINEAKHDVLLFTDADCKANSEDWISTMAAKFESKKIEFVLGFGAFFSSNSLLNRVIRFEGMLTAIQYFSFALNGAPYMGVGRNLAYRKSVYHKANGFQTHQVLLSGDDDLIVNKMATVNNVAIVTSRKSYLYSEGESSWKAFYRQKRRQLSSGNLYNLRDKLKLALFGASNFLYYALLVSLLITQSKTLLILGIFVIKQCCEYLIVGRLCQRFDNRDLVSRLLLIEPIYLIIITIAGVSTWFRRVDRWK